MSESYIDLKIGPETSKDSSMEDSLEWSRSTVLTNGRIIIRLLFLVERLPPGPLGAYVNIYNATD